MDLAGGVQANMLLLSQLHAIFATFTVGESILQGRGKTHISNHYRPMRQKLKDRAFRPVPTVPLSFRGIISY